MICIQIPNSPIWLTASIKFSRRQCKILWVKTKRRKSGSHLRYHKCRGKSKIKGQGVEHQIQIEYYRHYRYFNGSHTWREVWRKWQTVVDLLSNGNK